MALKLPGEDNIKVLFQIVELELELWITKKSEEHGICLLGKGPEAEICSRLQRDGKDCDFYGAAPYSFTR